MPKNKYYALAGLSLALLFCPLLMVRANSVWQIAGSNKGYISSGAGYEADITASDNGSIYAAFEDKNSGKKAQVRKFDGSSWSDLADSQNLQGLISASWGHKPILAARGNEVYAAFSDKASSNRARVKKWDGNNWADLSDVNYNSGFISSQEGEEPEIAFDKAKDTLYAAFADEASGHRVKVMGWNGSVWTAVADGDNPEGFVSNGAGTEVAIAPSKADNSMYLVYEDISASLRLRVKKWDGSHWSEVTDAAHPDGLITNTPGYSPSIALDSQDRIYLVYTYRKEGNTYVIRWDGSAWSNLGSGIGAKGKTIESTVIVDENDNVFIAMSQFKKIGKQKKSWRVRVRKWNGQAWQDVSDSSHRQGFLSKKGKGDPALALGNGKIYLIFTDYNSRRRARVMYFDPLNF